MKSLWTGRMANVVSVRTYIACVKSQLQCFSYKKLQYISTYLKSLYSTNIFESVIRYINLPLNHPNKLELYVEL